MVLAKDNSATSAGLTPDSPFYIFKTLKENIQIFFTFNAEQKVKQFLHLADVRLAEYQKMIEKGKTEIAQKTLEKYEKQLARALAKVEELKSKGKDVKDISERIATTTAKHIEVLENNLEKVPESAKEGIERALENSRKVIEKFQEGEQQRGQPSALPIEDEITNSKTLLSPSLTILFPNGGERWVKESSYQIRWTYPNPGKENYINVSLIGEHLKGIVTAEALPLNTALIPATDGQYIGKVPGIAPPGDKYKIKIFLIEKTKKEDLYPDINLYPDITVATDSSDNYFRIVAAPTSPCTLPENQASCLSLSVDDTCYWDEQNNACSPTRQLCFDSDNGINFNIQGRTFGFQELIYAQYTSNERIRREWKDACLVGNTLREYYCIDNYYMESELKDCPNGCSNGVCL